MSSWHTDSSAAAAAEFDEYAASYEQDLQKGLRFSGESSSYFAQGRVDCLSAHLQRLRISPRVILDFGCGTGSAVPRLLTVPGVEHAIGVDVSERLLEVARVEVRTDRATFRSSDVPITHEVDVAFCNGVFHHIAPHSRPSAVGFVLRALKPGGLFAFCENNPLNPGTRLVMRNIPFDRDAQPIRARAARTLLTNCGFHVLTVDYMFVFPRVLRGLRRLENRVAHLPVGAQYMVLARKSGEHAAAQPVVRHGTPDA